MAGCGEHHEIYKFLQASRGAAGGRSSNLSGQVKGIAGARLSAYENTDAPHMGGPATSKSQELSERRPVHG